MIILIVLILFLTISTAIIMPLLKPHSLISRKEPKARYEKEKSRIEREVQLDVGIGKALKDDVKDLSSEFSKKEAG